MSHSSELTAECVANYLRQYPDFFNQQPELLETLTIPHPSTGNVVSLVAKQLELARNKQHKLEIQLNTLLEIARNNDTFANRMHQLALALLNSSTLEMALNNLKRVLTDCFLADFIALKIIHENTNPVLDDFFIAPTDENLPCLTAELTHKNPRCGRLNGMQNKFLFADAASEVKSCAIIPLLAPELTALLVIGSRDENRFHYNLGNLFLTQLGEIVVTRLATFLKQ